MRAALLVLRIDNPRIGELLVRASAGLFDLVLVELRIQEGAVDGELDMLIM